jgi:hypothetical protein
MKERERQQLLNDFTEQYVDPVNSYGFEKGIVDELSNYVYGSVTQVLCETTLKTAYGLVNLYGYADYVQANRIIDLKYAEKYDLLKYYESSQRLIYPFCFNEQGNQIEYFDFLASNGREIFLETYRYKPDEDIPKIVFLCEQFIEFLIENRKSITDKKVFGLE